MNTLVVGFGKMGMLHAATLKALEAADEIIVCESSPLIREGIKVFGGHLKVYENIKDALDRESVSAAVIATPNDTHFNIFSELLERGLPMFIEKPFVADFEEAKAACRKLASCKNPRPVVMIGYCLRFVATFLLAKEVLSKGVLGDILHFEATMFSSDVEQPQGGWRFEKQRKGGGVLLDLGSHLTDLVRFLFGMPQELSGVVESWYSKGVEDFAEARVSYGHFGGTMKVCWSMPNVRKPLASIAIVGRNGTMNVTNDEVHFALTRASSGFPSGYSRKDITQLGRAVPFDLAGPFYTEQLMEFVAAVRDGGEYRNGACESLENHQVIELIRRSGGRPVPVERVTCDR